MKNTTRILAMFLLLALASTVLFWKFFALKLLPVDSPDLDSALRYMGEPLAKSWVYFYRGNDLYQRADSDADKSLSGSILLLDRAIDEYLESLDIRETREARENLETAQKELRRLKEEQSFKDKTEEEEKSEDEPKDGGDDPKSGSGSDSGSGSTGSKTDEPGMWSWGKDGNSGSDGSGKAKTLPNSKDGKNQEAEQKSWPRGYTNSGTFFEGFSWSTSVDWLSEQDEKTLGNSLEFLKEIQNQKGRYTRPNGIPEAGDGMGGMFEKYFWDSSFFSNERDVDPYDY